MDGADDFDFFYNDLDFDEDDSMEHVDDERDDCALQRADCQSQTRGDDILEKVKNILKCMKEEACASSNGPGAS
ncbi:hypothetical protein B0H10DRAFT_2226305 [Mycena sp. CBHHK59/15]|nr:hypothetical protein B0H10DRAFT_2226305 [Mycena sp. CBHHK59/15]